MGEGATDAEALAAGGLRWLTGLAREGNGAALTWAGTPGGDDVDPTLYGGSAGIVITLLEAHRYFGDDRYADAAICGARGIAAGVWCDNTEEFLAAQLRTGKAGSSTAVDHIEVLGDAIAQIPAKHRRKLLIRSDGAGASHDLLDWLTDQGQVRGRRVEYSVGFAITEKIRTAIDLVPKRVWTPASGADGGVREGGAPQPESPGGSEEPARAGSTIPQGRRP